MESFRESLLAPLLAGYRLDPDGIHGPAHWRRVEANGLRLARETGADPVVVGLFALFHDACRMSEGRDPDHGPRGAVLAEELHGRLFTILPEQLRLLVRACRTHTIGQPGEDADVTVLTCWDADRLDFWRLGIRPDPSFLSTEAARRKEMIEWAARR